MIINFTHDEPNKIYEQIIYPAGEIQIRIKPEFHDQIKTAETITVRARLTSYSDNRAETAQKLAANFYSLRLLVSAVNGVSGHIRLGLDLPYLPYSRADRRFVPGDCYGLDVMRKSLGWFSGVRTYDIHNTVPVKWDMTITNVAPTMFHRQAIEDFARFHNRQRITVLWPDEGAAKRYRLPDQVGVVKIQQLNATKKRNVTTGEFEGFTVPERKKFDNDCVLVIDDICDGGGTFLGVTGNLYWKDLGLCVTHGIFSQGFDKLNGRFSRIYTTNSVRDLKSNGILQVSDAFRAMEIDMNLAKSSKAV